MTDCRSMCPEIWMVRSVEGEKIQSLSSSFNIFVPFSLAGERYSVSAAWSPSAQDSDSMVLDVLGPWITIFDFKYLVSDDIFSSILSRISFPVGCADSMEAISNSATVIRIMPVIL